MISAVLVALAHAGDPVLPAWRTFAAVVAERPGYHAFEVVFDGRVCLGTVTLEPVPPPVVVPIRDLDRRRRKPAIRSYVSECRPGTAADLTGRVPEGELKAAARRLKRHVPRIEAVRHLYTADRVVAVMDFVLDAPEGRDRRVWRTTSAVAFHRGSDAVTWSQPTPSDPYWVSCPGCEQDWLDWRPPASLEGASILAGAHRDPDGPYGEARATLLDAVRHHTPGEVPDLQALLTDGRFDPVGVTGGVTWAVQLRAGGRIDQRSLEIPVLDGGSPFEVEGSGLAVEGRLDWASAELVATVRRGQARAEVRLPLHDVELTGPPGAPRLRRAASLDALSCVAIELDQVCFTPRIEPLRWWLVRGP